jgi:hypothetical protein
MSDTGKQSPLGINFQGSALANVGLTINKIAASYMGSSKTNADYQFGKIVQDTILRLQTHGIRDAYVRNLVSRTGASDVYDNLINIGSGSIPALGNSSPPTYKVADPSGIWTTTAVKFGEQKVSPSLPGPANSGYALTSNTDQGQQATWYPYTGHSSTNPNTSITQWGYLRLHALQAWNEFNWNGEQLQWNTPEYKEFLSSFLTADSFVSYANQATFAMHNSKKFLEGTYSNMNDLISADISGVSLASWDWGSDLINLGKALDLSTIDSFGLPSNLLMTLYKNNAMTSDIVLALLAAELTHGEITSISTGTAGQVPLETEQKIYGAFSIISGSSLVNIISVLNCKTRGLTSLSDLLSIKKLFPTSYQTLTVPIYNIAPGPTNSKTYYLIYTNSGLNPQLISSAVSEIVGIQTLPGSPSTTSSTSEGTNYTKLAAGFGSYLYNVLPAEDAVAAGAFSYSMMQIRNIKYCDIETFAQVVRANETISGLNLVNGTDKPTDQSLANQSTTLCSLGSGVYGTYTMSDLFGCMSGLPYPWQLIYQRIKQIETTKLRNIYRENFLAITWEGAEITVIPETREVPIPDTDPVEFQTEYRVGSFVVSSPGGGYGRGTAPDPIITTSNGGAGTSIVGINDATAGSNGTGTFGRITSVTVTNQGSWQPTPPTATIESPPTANLAVQANGSVATGGVNTASGTNPWPEPMNTIIQAYIDQANTEIVSIRNSKPGISKLLNSYWDVCGEQLAREQRTRYIAFSPVAIIPTESSTVIRKDYFSNPYPFSQYTFTDSVPQLAQDTKPHMAVQTLEAISDMATIGGQSLVALMRESRNKNRMLEAGINQDNAIPDSLVSTDIKEITANGVMLDPDSQLGYSLPAWPNNIKPRGYIDVDANKNTRFANTESFSPGDIITVTENTQSVVVNTLVPVGPISFDPTGQLSFDPTGPTAFDGESILYPYIISAPIDTNPAIPVNLDARYTSSTLLPSSLSVQDAIDQVIECNCDCWID